MQCGESSEKLIVEPIKNEFHSRLRFSRRGCFKYIVVYIFYHPNLCSISGLVAMAQNEGTESSIEFFFTLDAAPELQNKHTIFAKVSGETIYNLLKLNESQTDADRPLYPHKINKVKILNNPFDDLVPSVETKRAKNENTQSKKKRQEGVKNFNLISFGEEAEQDEQEMEKIPKESKNHAETSSSKTESSTSLKTKETKKQLQTSSNDPINPLDDSDSDYESTIEKEKLLELERQRKEIQDQIKDIKKQYHKDRKDKSQPKDVKEPQTQPQHEDETIRVYLDEKEKYKQKKLNVKGKSREDFTLSLLAKFKNKLQSALESQPSDDGENSDENWLSHKLDFSESQAAVLAKDASKKEDDWYDIYDPRNPLNKRKRGAEKPLNSSSSKKNNL